MSTALRAKRLRFNTTVANSIDYNPIKTICRDCSQPILEYASKSSSRPRRLCHRCLAAYFPNVKVSK